MLGTEGLLSEGASGRSDAAASQWAGPVATTATDDAFGSPFCYAWTPQRPTNDKRFALQARSLYPGNSILGSSTAVTSRSRPICLLGSMPHADFDRHSAHSGPGANPNAGDAPLQLPPPAPPRAMPPSVLPATTAETTNGKELTGVGSARGIRWRGQLEGISKSAADASQSSDDGATGSDDLLRHPERVARDAPPWLVSLVFHLILLLVLALMSTPVGTSIGTVMLSIGQSEVESPVELTEFAVAEVAVESDADMLDQTEPESVSVFDSAELTEVESISPVEVGAGLQIASDQPMFNGRTGAMRQALLAMYGGTPETQEAVKLGLDWLRRNQHRKGFWSMRGPYRDGGTSEIKSAATAMALLAFLGDGHTHLSGEYAEVVEKGMKFLVSQQDREGFFAGDARRHEKMYAQAQATIAICELYGMTKDSWLRPRAQLALDFAAYAQSAEGGWRYDPKDGSDTSVTGWFVMAIKSGQSAGLDVDSYLLSRVEDYLDTVAYFDNAAYSYQKGGTPSPAMTAEGLLCRQYIGWKRDHPPLRRGIDALLIDSPFDLADHDVYYWYYATQVLHHYGGDPWKKWNSVMREALPGSQVKQGREKGSWAPQSDRWGSNSGRLYTTCMSLFCLEVYYRHMPLYKSIEK